MARLQAAALRGAARTFTPATPANRQAPGRGHHCRRSRYLPGGDLGTAVERAEVGAPAATVSRVLASRRSRSAPPNGPKARYDRSRSGSRSSSGVSGRTLMRPGRRGFTRSFP